VRVDIDGGDDVSFGVGLSPDGRIIYRGSGKLHYSIDAQMEAWAMVLLPDGNSLSVGNAGDGKAWDVALFRTPF
jgi:hypothetical protein